MLAAFTAVFRTVPLLPHFLQSHAIASRDDGALWSGWHQGRQRYAVWALQIEDLPPAVQAAVEAACRQARGHLAAALLPGGPRQLHVTLATAGFLDGDAALPDAYGRPQLARDLRALRRLAAAPLRLGLGGGWGSFEMAPYLDVQEDVQEGAAPDGAVQPRPLPTRAGLHEALAGAQRRVALTEPLRPYVPHVTLGAYSQPWPRARVAAWLAGLPAPGRWHAVLGSISLLSFAAQALQGPLTCHARYDLVARRLRWLAPPAWAGGQGR